MATEQNRTQEGGVGQSQRDPELFGWIKSPICLDWVQVIRTAETSITMTSAKFLYKDAI